MGAFVYREASGYGVFSADEVRLVWAYAADVVAEADLDLLVFALEMVYVPTGGFVVGDGSAGSGQFQAGGTTNDSFVVADKGSISLGDVAGRLSWTVDPGIIYAGNPGSPSGSTQASFPTGFQAFYVMKRQVTQGEYVNFLNTLTQAQATVRHFAVTEWASDRRHAITGYAVGAYGTSLPYVPHGFMRWADSAAFADWAGLRPMTEFECEKAGRGPAMPVELEFAWGGTDYATVAGVVNAGTITERPMPEEANIAWWGGVTDWLGFVRAGSFAAPGRSRERAGAGFYGVLDLSGEPGDWTVTVGNTAGQAFTGLHGDGSLSTGGLADVPSWPAADAAGAGSRGSL